MKLENGKKKKKGVQWPRTLRGTTLNKAEQVSLIKDLQGFTIPIYTKKGWV